MKELLYIVLIIISLTFFKGCSEGNSSSTHTTSEPTINMLTGTTYTVYKGDIITATSIDAKINVMKTLNNETTLVKLVSGSATLIRN
jgi:uncharacterized lipoprotein YehR (DUF1307 family)